MDDNVRSKNPAVTDNALSNCHGDWYEWLLAISAWNWHIAHPAAHLLVKLPSVSTFNVARLYCIRLQELIEDLREKVKYTAGVSLITSNPDFVLLNRQSIATPATFHSLPIKSVTETTIDFIDTLYSCFDGKCDFQDIVGFLSAKLSLRPDRRLQFSHEGSLMKALYAHLQTREWVINPRGLKYYACSATLNAADEAALQTVATHSITTVFSTPQRAVDMAFEIDTVQQAELVWGAILGL